MIAMAAKIIRFWRGVKVDHNRAAVQIELRVLEFLFGPSPVLFFLENWLDPNGLQASFRGTYFLPVMYVKAVRRELHLHLRYSDFFVPVGVPPGVCRRFSRADEMARCLVRSNDEKQALRDLMKCLL